MSLLLLLTGSTQIAAPGQIATSVNVRAVSAGGGSTVTPVTIAAGASFPAVTATGETVLLSGWTESIAVSSSDVTASLISA